MKPVPILVALGLFFILCLMPSRVLADQSNSFVTIVNPVRISTYNKDPQASLLAEYSEVQKRSLPATWLLTDDVLNNSSMVTTLKSFDPKQEFGIFLEISPALAKEAQVDYPKSVQWYFANAVFLSGYSQGDRKKLIDTVFSDFKNQFGFYPKVVGSWWTDSYSLNYLHQKYQITTNLGLADQYSTDGYQVWGSYWSTAFYPSLLNVGIPANSLSNKLDVVNLEWAPRDPLNGYGPGEASKYSTQDYQTLNLGDDYFAKLFNLYAVSHNNSFGQITVGLEADLSPEVFQQTFARQLNLISTQSQVQVVLASQFASWYIQHFPNLSPPQIIVSQDLLGGNKQAIWYQSPNFRAGLTYDPLTNQTKIIDLRTYQPEIEDPYYLTPNSEMKLHVNTPSLIDSVNVPNDGWLISTSLLNSINQNESGLKITYQNGQTINMSDQGINLTGQLSQPVPKTITSGKVIKIDSDGKSLLMTPVSMWLAPPAGRVINTFLPELPLLLRQRRGVIEIALIGGLLVVGQLLIFGKIKRKRRPFILISSLTILSLPLIWILIHNRQFMVTQGEVDGLFRLSQMPVGKVVVYDHECLNCQWQTISKPAIYANKRGYVADLSHDPIIYNKIIFETKSRAEGRKALVDLKAKYIYLAKYGNYIETLPFSPGDYNIEMIFENANCQIWQVKS